MNNTQIPTQVELNNKGYNIMAILFSADEANTFMTKHKKASVIKVIKNRTQNKEIIILADKNDRGTYLKEKLHYA